MNRINKQIILLIVILIFSITAFSQINNQKIVRMGERSTENFNQNWFFKRYGLQADGNYLKEESNLHINYIIDSTWKQLDLPHDFAIYGPFRADLAGETGKLPYQGIGWYKKQFFVNKDDQTKNIYIDFDGAMAYAEVWLNGEYVGTHPYGYSSFRLDLTPYLKYNENNWIVVRLNTEKWESRWYSGAGIYRNVWLVKTEKIHISHWGTFITTPEVDAQEALIDLKIEIENNTQKQEKILVKSNIYEYKNRSLSVYVGSFQDYSITLHADSVHKLKMQTQLKNPKLWDITSPNQYIVETIIYKKNTPLDTFYTSFGIRSLDFSVQNGFLLNGKHVKIQGVCNHHDLGALGAIVNRSGIKRQLLLLKEMGCNAIRTSHNPPAPELLELADELGFLVMDEAFDCWQKGKREWDYNKLFKEWYQKDLSAMILRDRNHPSVFVWSIGNEVMDQRDIALTKEIADYARSLDTTRPITNGYNDPDASREIGSVISLDIMGVNYFFNQQPKWDADPRYKQMPTIGTETSSCVSTRGAYFFDTFYKNWQIASYDGAYPDWGCSPDEQFRILKKLPQLLGEFVWTGFDYLGEPTPYNSSATNLLNFRNDSTKRIELEKKLDEIKKNNPPSRSSYFGIIDLAGFPKDRFYLYQSQWKNDFPMAHILPHWNWPDRIDSIVPVHVYSSGDEAELFLNGVTQGRIKLRNNVDFRFVWDSVRYQPGHLEVITYKNGKLWASSIIKTTQKPNELHLSSDQKTLYSDPENLIFVTVKTTDINGLVVPDCNDEILFEIEGPGELIATDNGDPTSWESFQSNKKALFNGLALVIIKPLKDKEGVIILKASSKSLKSAQIEIVVKKQ